MEEDAYDVAQICHNEDLVNDSIIEFPEHNQHYCSTCGQKTITTCQNSQCNKRQRGVSQTLGIGFYRKPLYCNACGKPLLWTERSLKAAQELINDTEELSPEDMAVASASLPDIITDSPQTYIATQKLRRILGKGGVGLSTAIRDMLVDIVSETVKKS